MSKKKREDIQCLRAFAIIMVVLTHFYKSYFPNGYVGVDIFFVISGFVIAMVFPKEWTLENVIDFYFRRIKRILTLYFTFIFISLLSVILFAPEDSVNVNLDKGRKAILFGTNVMSPEIAHLRLERLIQKADDIFPHTWSLCLEIQWYLLAPLVFYFTSYRKTVCKVVMIASGVYYIHTDSSTSFYSIFARLWEFMIGILTYETLRVSEKEGNDEDEIPLVNSKTSSVDKFMLNSLSKTITLTLLLGFIPVYVDGTILRILVTVATAGLLISGSSVKVRVFNNPVFSWLGNVSYSLYLVHWPLCVLAMHSGFQFRFEIGICVSLFLAGVVYEFFEKKYLLWEKKTILIFVLAMFGTTLYLSIEGMKIHQTLHNGLSSQERIDNIAQKMPWIPLNIAAGGLQNSTNNMGSPLCEYEELFGFATNPPLGHCKMPNGNGTENILVLGNSWAANQGPSIIYEAFKKFAKNFDVYSLVGCEPLQISPFCKQGLSYGKTAVEYFKPDVLFIIHRVISATAPFNVTQIDKDPLFNEFMDHVRFYEKFAKKIYIQQALPWCTKACTSSAVRAMIAKGKNLTEIGDKLILRDDYYPRLRIAEVINRCKKCEVIDFLPWYPLGNNGKPVPYDLERNLVFLDDQVHLNQFGKAHLQPLFYDLASNFEFE